MMNNDQTTATICVQRQIGLLENVFEIRLILLAEPWKKLEEV